MSSQMPKASYEGSVTHRRSVMRSGRWEPTDLGDGCFNHHTPSVNDECTYDGPVPAPVVEVAPVAAPTAAGEPVKVSFDPAGQGKAVVVVKSRDAQSRAPIVVGEVVAGPPVRDFLPDGWDLTVGDVLRLADQLRASGQDLNEKIKAAASAETGYVARLAIEPVK